jgi:hypothetical protein
MVLADHQSGLTGSSLLPLQPLEESYVSIAVWCSPYRALISPNGGSCLRANPAIWATGSKAAAVKQHL